MDRQKIENDLLNASFSDMQSEALSYLFAEMATKEDIRALRAEIRGESRAVRDEIASETRAILGEMVVMKAELRADVSELGRELMDSIARYQDRLFTHVLTLIGALTAIIALMLLLIR